jgi:glycine/D-amino acid oxidase-like deaminating enzyme
LSIATGDRVLVIGAGMAGLAAAERLLDAGVRVTVIDAFPVPGGRTASFDVSTPVAGLIAGDVVEHGLHAWFQHYTELFGLMARAGVPKPPLAGNGVYFYEPRHGHFALEGGPMAWLLGAARAPVELTGPKLPALRAFSRLTNQLDRALADPVATDRESGRALLERHGVPRAAIEHVFRPCLFSLTSLPIEDLSALEVLRWMANLLPDPRMRMLEGGSTAAMCAPISEYLRGRGADLRYGVEVKRLSLDAAGRARLVLAQAPDRTGVRHLLVPGFGSDEPPDPAQFAAVVSTLPWERLRDLTAEPLPEFARAIWARLRQLENVHPLTIRLWFERPIAGAEERYILSSGTLFDVVRPTRERVRYQGVHMLDALVENVRTHLAAFDYRAERYLHDRPEVDPIVERMLGDLEPMFPGQIRGNRVLRSFLHTREGIIACRPGVWSLRPPQYIGSPQFVLAGDWTRQSYGTCMEGAVRSGQMAASALLSGRQPEEPIESAFFRLLGSIKSAVGLIAASPPA